MYAVIFLYMGSHHELHTDSELAARNTAAFVSRGASITVAVYKGNRCIDVYQNGEIA